MAKKFTRSYWGRTRANFPPSAAGLRAWYRQFGRPYRDQVELVQEGEEPRLRVNGTLIDVIRGGAGSPKWGWKSIGETATAANIDEQPQPEDPTDPTTPITTTSEGVPPRGGGWDSGAATDDPMDDPTPGEEDPEWYEPDPEPVAQRVWSQAENKWVEKKRGEEGYDDTWGGYFKTGDPCEQGDESDERFKELQGVTGGCPEPPPPPEECADGQDRVNGKCPPPANGKCDDQPGTVWDEALGRCVYPPPVPGDPTPGYRTYGMDPNNPNQPWEVDLSYLKDAPPFEFEYDPWVEPEAFSYAPYEQPEAFSYGEFTPPTGQELLEEDPGYQFRLDEGRKAMERSAAARGTLRSGATLKGLMDYGQNTASEEYQKAYNRRLREWQEGSGLAERAWDRNLAAGQWGYGTNLGAARDQWALGRGAQLEGYGVNRQNAYQLARDRYAPQLASWTAEQRAKERAALEKYGRQWQAYTYGQPSASTIYQTGAGYSTK
ncbi:hypothetical protein [uncultured Mediterranean phage uvDeep-CGR2-AD3-C76]|nr:hypothetical protein [uncultured Mediterranean phage uvDeep-CGR2-AD3-C76]